MPTTRKSPFATSFNSAIKNGVPCWTAVQKISKRTGKSPSTIFASLYNAGWCSRQKINGQWFYWPVNGKKSKSSFNKQSQWNSVQCFIDWCIGSGFCTPKQFKSFGSNPTAFFNFIWKNWNKSFTKMNGTAPKASKKSKTTKTKSKSKKRTTTKAKKSTTTKAKSRKTSKSYRFPTTTKSRKSSTRRYRQAA